MLVERWIETGGQNAVGLAGCGRIHRRPHNGRASALAVAAFDVTRTIQPYTVMRSNVMSSSASVVGLSSVVIITVGSGALHRCHGETPRRSVLRIMMDEKKFEVPSLIILLYVNVVPVL